MPHNNIIGINIDGQKYTRGFDQIEVMRDFSNLCGTFRFVTVNSKNVAVSIFPIKRGSLCEIYIDDSKIMTGYVEQLHIQTETINKTVTISGRDITCDIVDSKEVFASLSAPQSLDHIVGNVLDTLKLSDRVKFKNKYGAITSNEYHSAEDAVSGFDVIADAAAKKSYLLTTDADGNIQNLRSSGEQLKTIIYPEICQAYTLIYDDSKRYHDYILKIQASATSDSDQPDESQFIKGVAKPLKQGLAGATYRATDSVIRPTRRLMFTSTDDAQSDDDVKNRCLWEMTTRKSEATELTVRLAGFYAKEDNKLWELNKLININIPELGLTEPLLIKGIKFSKDISGASITELTLCDRIAFEAELDKIRASEKKAKKDDVEDSPEAAEQRGIKEFIGVGKSTTTVGK